MFSARMGFLVAALGLFSPAAVFGQATANIVGTVKDTSEGGVPGARVTAVNVQTGLRATRESGPDGSYSIPLLPAGQYRLEVEKEGFQRYSQSGIMLAVGDNARLDAILTVGSVAESVTVTAAAPLLETETGTIRGLVDQQRIVDLPLNGRRVTNLMQIQAGVIQRSSGTSEGDAFVVNGSRQSGVYFTLDGGMNTDSYRNYSGVFPNPDAVQEVSIQKSNFSAEYANATGAVVTVATKSGLTSFTAPHSSSCATASSTRATFSPRAAIHSSGRSSAERSAVRSLRTNCFSSARIRAREHAATRN